MDKIHNRRSHFPGGLVLTAPAIGAINQNDINNLRTTLSGLGIISKLINIPLSIAEKVTRICYIATKE